MRFSIAAAFLICMATTTQAQSVRVMTYNIRLDTPQDGINAWPNRVEKVTDLLQKYNPDVIGLQEVLHHQLQDLLNRLPDYSYVGVGRDDGQQKGEYSAILFRKSRFGLLHDSTFWLSETPQVAGSKSWDAAITRVATWARLYDKVTRKEFLLLNTHFDHMGKLAREKSAELIQGKAGALAKGNPIIITGDFNCTFEESPYQKMLRAGDITLYDATIGVHTGTFCGFKVGGITCNPIDYIFHSKECVPRAYKVIDDNDGTYYPSDHLPVFAEFEFADEK